MSRIPFPSKLKDFSPALLTELLAEKHPTVRVEAVRIVEHAQCGDGVASTADRVKLELEYSLGCDAGLPDEIVLKTILLHPYLRFGLPMILGLSNTLNRLDSIPLLGKLIRPLVFTMVNLYQRFFPHAPEAMYANETHFYCDIRPELDIEAPAAYGGVFEKETGHFGVLMEDLSLREARFPNALSEISMEEMQSLMKQLASLHARFWESPRLEGDLSWVPTTSKGGMFPVFDAIGLDVIRDQVRKNAFKQELIAPLNRSIDDMWADVWKAQALFDQGPITLLHGDTHMGNTYLLPGGKGGFLDWQLMVKGSWAHDFTYLVCTGLATETRRKHERELLTLYLDELRRHGVENPPSQEEAWLRHRQAAIWGLVIGWLITPPANYGQEITAANIQRMVAAVQDLETFKALS